MKNKEKINKTLQIIANTLYINQHWIKHIGLLNGKMGIAIYLYHYARYSKHHIYEEIADDFIDDVIDNKTSNIRHPNFPGGISGLAWGFTYLIENKFIEIEDDSVLDDLEAYLLNNIPAKIPIKTPELIRLFGNGLYYVAKMKRQTINEKDVIAIKTLQKKCRYIIKECEANAVFDIKYFNSLLYFLTETAKNKINKKTASSLLPIIGDILLGQSDYSICDEEDIYILRKNIEQVRLLTSKKDVWNQIESKLPHKIVCGLSSFNWQNFIYYSFAGTQINDSLLGEIETFIERELDNLHQLDFTLTGKLLNIGLGLMLNGE
jgi:hypothetical protein